MKTRETTSVNTNETTQTEDTNKSERAKDILCGVLIALGVWTAGILLSGWIAFIEDFEFYWSGNLVMLFPWLFGAVCVAAAVLSAKKDMPILFRTAMTALLLPAAAFLANAALEWIFQRTGLGATPVDAVRIPFALLGIPAASVWNRYDFISDFGVLDLRFITWSAFALPMLAGLVAAAVIYRRNRTEKGNERNGS
ncbi:MAG: hypothetical protein IK118_01080 [Clostridia bacterium]|nr:hypothetical protein [Clostridia bacterium]